MSQRDCRKVALYFNITNLVLNKIVNNLLTSNDKMEVLHVELTFVHKSSVVN